MSIKSVYKKIRFCVRDVFHNKKQRTAFGIPIFHLLQAIVRVDVLQKT